MGPGGDLISTQQKALKKGAQAVQPMKLGLYARLFKRFVDISVSTVFLLIFAVMFIFLALAIVIDTKGPVIYTQVRIGRRRRPFKVYKLRTMIEGAHALAAVPPANGSPFVQRENDPRVTRVGRFLRRFSIDEFPQFINVLKGDMSVIGPRPFIPEEAQVIGEEYHARYSVRPGLTGYAQINGRNDLTLEERMAYDLYYVEHLSASLDVEILLKSVFVVLRRDGAY